MSTGIRGPRTLPEMFLPRSNAHDTAPAIMVLFAEKREMTALTACFKSKTPVLKVRPEFSIDEIRNLPSFVSGPVKPVKKRTHTGQKGQGREIAHKQRRIKRRRHINMRYSPDAHSLYSAKRLAYHKRRPELIHPRSNLHARNLRIEIVSAHDHNYATARQMLGKNSRNAAGQSTTHTVNI